MRQITPQELQDGLQRQKRQQAELDAAIAKEDAALAVKATQKLAIAAAEARRALPHSNLFCLACGSNSCLHVQRSRRNILTPRETSILVALCNPDLAELKDLAFALHICHGSLKVYMSKIYVKLGWTGGNTRKLVLWAIANRESLGIVLPAPDQFPKVVAA